MSNIHALLSLCTLVARMVLCDDVYTCKGTCSAHQEKEVEFSCHVLTGGGTDHLMWRAHRQNAYLVFSCKICTSYSFHFIFPNLKRFRQNTHVKHRITLLYLCMLLLSMSSDIEVNPMP